MKNLIVLLFLGIAAALGVSTAVDGVYDGRTIIAVFLLVMAVIVNFTPRGARS